MKLYNPSTTDVYEILGGLDIEPVLPGGTSIEISDKRGGNLLARYGFLINWTKLPNCPTFRSDNVKEIKRIEKHLTEEQEKRLIEEQKKKVFKTKENNDLKIFISFKDEGEDLLVAKEMNDRVRVLGYEVFFFKHSHLPSEEIAGIIPKLESSDMVIAILSNRTKESAFVVQEIGIAVANHIPVFPIAIEKLESFDIGFFRDINAERYDKHQSIEKVMVNFDRAVYKRFAESKNLELVKKKSNTISNLISVWASLMTSIHLFKEKDSGAPLDIIRIELNNKRKYILEVESDLMNIFDEDSEYVVVINKIMELINSALRVEFLIDGGRSWNEWIGFIQDLQIKLIKLRDLIKKEDVNFPNLNDERRKVKNILVGWLNGIDPNGGLNEFVDNADENTTLLLRIYYFSTFIENPLENYKDLAEDIMRLSWARTNTDYIKIQKKLNSLKQKASAL